MDQLTNTLPVASPQKSFPKWPFIALFSFFLGIASILAYQKYLPTRSNLVAPSPSAAAALSEVERADDPFAGWLTYTNSVHHLSFKYPDTWQIDKTNDSEAINATLTLTKDKANIKMYFKLDGIGGQGETLEGKPFTLDGHSLYRYEAENTYSNTQIVGITDKLTESLGVFKLDNITYAIALNYPFGSTQGADLTKEFDQILSTFKFSDQVQVINTDNWETYQAKVKYSLSFKYEPGGTLTEGENPPVDIIHLVYSNKQIDWFIHKNQENLSFQEFIQQNANSNGSIEENKTIGKFTGTYIVVPQAQKDQFSFAGPSISYYFQDSLPDSLIHEIRIVFTKETLTEADYQYFDTFVKTASLH